MSKIVKHIFLDTQDKRAGTTNYTPEWSLDTGKAIHGHYSIGLKSCVIPNLVYPVNDTNNTVIFSEGGAGDITSTLTNQSYTGTQLATELQSVLNADGGLAYTVSYDNQTGKLTFTVSSSTVQFKTSDTAMTSSYILGFNTATDTADSATVVSTYPIRLDGSRYLDIEMNTSTHSISSKNSSSPFVRVPLTAGFGSIVVYENDSVSDNLMVMDASQMNNLRLRIRDDTGSDFVLPANAYCSFTLNLYSSAS